MSSEKKNKNKDSKMFSIDDLFDKSQKFEKKIRLKLVQSDTIKYPYKTKYFNAKEWFLWVSFTTTTHSGFIRFQLYLSSFLFKRVMSFTLVV